MSFLLDTTVVSEWVKVRPNRGVIRWLAAADEDRLSLSVVTLAELRYGIERMPVGARRKRLDAWCATSCHCALRGAFCRSTAQLPMHGEAWWRAGRQRGGP
jgi:hypothetical protein